jgi:UDP-GlcNAc3NAcA epimerase
MKIFTVVGARPQFIKAAAVSRVIRDKYGGKLREVIVHTGQHHDGNMSQVFFDQLDIPPPDYNLELSGGLHGEMTGRMLEAIEKVLLLEKPDWVLVYGDTNSTLAGALAAAKLHIPVAHVEAGLRSFNMRMPEEINRILADRVSSLLFCPTETAVANLQNEGVSRGVHQVGDVMYDVALFYRKRAGCRASILEELRLKPKRYVLATCHRAENTDDAHNLGEILLGLSQIAKDRMPVVLPLHPRTLKKVNEFGLNHVVASLTILEPVSFLDMIALEKDAAVILTDSGGVQKEAFFYGVPCVTMREQTEWIETVALGWNVLVGASHIKIREATQKVIHSKKARGNSKPYGDGRSAEAIIKLILGGEVKHN